MFEFLSWMAVVYVFGIAALPIVYLALPNLMDRGFGVARPVGLLVFGTVMWLLSSSCIS